MKTAKCKVCGCKIEAYEVGATIKESKRYPSYNDICDDCFEDQEANDMEYDED